MTQRAPAGRVSLRAIIAPINLTVLVASLLYTQIFAEFVVSAFYAGQSVAVVTAVVMVIWVFIAVTAYVVISRPPGVGS